MRIADAVSQRAINLSNEKALVNTLVYKVYLYDEEIAVYFNTQDKPVEKKYIISN